MVLLLFIVVQNKNLLQKNIVIINLLDYFISNQFYNDEINIFFSSIN